MTRLPPGGQNSQKANLFEIRSPSLWPGSLRGVRILKKRTFLKLEALLCDQAPSRGSALWGKNVKKPMLFLLKAPFCWLMLKLKQIAWFREVVMFYGYVRACGEWPIAHYKSRNRTSRSTHGTKSPDIKHTSPNLELYIQTSNI